MVAALLLAWAVPAGALEPIKAQPVFRTGTAGAIVSQAIPFEVENNLIWIKVPAGGSKLKFVLDSGAGWTFMNLKVARRLGYALTRPHAVHSVLGLQESWVIDGFDASVGGIPLPQKIAVMDLPVGPKHGRSHWVPDGLIGQDFFRGRVVEIDYEKRVVRVLDHWNRTLNSTELPIRIHGDAMCVPVGVNGLAPKWTRLDTGCCTALEWSDAVVDPMEYPGARTPLVFVTNVRLGEISAPMVKVNLRARAVFPMEAGLLGNGLLSRYHVVIDGQQMKLVLETR